MSSDSTADIRAGLAAAGILIREGGAAFGGIPVADGVARLWIEGEGADDGEGRSDAGTEQS